MDRIVRARFYQVEAVEAQNNPDSFSVCLQNLWNRPDRAEYQDLGHEILVRLERFAVDPRDGDFLSGEFVRQQTDNIPPVAAPGQPLVGNANPLGHRCAFRYHIPTGIILLESKREATTPGRINAFLRKILRGHRGFFMSPALTESALQRLREGTPRRVSLRVARPNIDMVDNPNLPLERSIDQLANFFEGPSIEVSSGFPRGQRDGVLNVRNIMRAFRWARDEVGYVERFSVKISEEPEPIDLFAEQMKIDQVLDLDSVNVERNYDVRSAFLSDGFRANLPAIRHVYGQQIR